MPLPQLDEPDWGDVDVPAPPPSTTPAKATTPSNKKTPTSKSGAKQAAKQQPAKEGVDEEVVAAAAPSVSIWSGAARDKAVAQQTEAQQSSVIKKKTNAGSSAGVTAAATAAAAAAGSKKVDKRSHAVAAASDEVVDKAAAKSSAKPAYKNAPGNASKHDGKASDASTEAKPTVKRAKQDGKDKKDTAAAAATATTDGVTATATDGADGTDGAEAAERVSKRPTLTKKQKMKIKRARLALEAATAAGETAPMQVVAPAASDVDKKSKKNKFKNQEYAERLAVAKLAPRKPTPMAVDDAPAVTPAAAGKGKAAAKPTVAAKKVDNDSDDDDDDNDSSETKPTSKAEAPKSAKASKTPVATTAADKLRGARFRWINEQLYTTTGKLAQKLFKDDPKLFDIYHEGFRTQVRSWPVNPVDVMIKYLETKPANLSVADFGCGEAKIAATAAQNVHSFDLVAANDSVVACDIAHVPLANEAIDIAIFSLSLMGTNCIEFLMEARRVLKPKGTLKIAEVLSRLHSPKQFIAVLKELGFDLVNQDGTNNVFIVMEFIKTPRASTVSKQNIQQYKDMLKPCLYKKR
ncbi:cerebral protein 1 [Capsaspora owczarzaki ATCC 30864]|uniref:Ribosomal RNA-processing protein 8 n=1 Tax=Capsaspora owczarzaki (strain ATCC 30864) TaxID=595528 RepID=A0A0D2X495_CAPO3|nr:cerebral protein 1 [Capsaspora owczarzaki ATCC 30864]KJE95669.1 cerebral protein 1 [Capsaspora owczarzaki ATCC 30864]|eukprot:XP_004345685.1 cerebral protein 1 [Capsaspora owczarzaki ATCC 30864]